MIGIPPHTTHSRVWIPLSIAIAAIGLTLGACDDSKSTTALLDKARLDREAGNDPAAIVDLKNVLAQDPKNTDARLLIAQIYIDIANGNGALGELDRAAQNGADELHLAGLRAEADVLAGRYENAVRDTANPPTGASNDLKAGLLGYRGAALAGLGNRPGARVAFDEGMSIDPHSVALLVSMARADLNTGNLTEARQAYSEAVKEAPKDPRVVQLEGDVDYVGQHYAEAEKVYQRIVDAEAWNNLARSDLAATKLALGKTSDAIDILDAVLNDPDQADVPKDPMLLYVRALAAFIAKDYPSAQEYSETVVGDAPNFEPSRLIAGASSYALKEYERAYYYLSRYAFDSSGDKLARKLLAAVELRLGRAKESVATLTPLLEKDGDDPELLALIGSASARSGNLREAKHYLSEAIENQPDNAGLHIELGRTELALGDAQAGIDEFKKAVVADVTTVIPEVPLFLAYFHTNERDKARAVAEQLTRRDPNSPIGFNMIGTLDVAGGDIAGGRAAFLQAQKIVPGDVNANRALARIALADGNRGEARRYYQNVLNDHPDDTQTSIDLADLEVGDHHYQQAEAILNAAVKASPSDRAPVIALSRYWLLEARAQQALDAAQLGLKTFPQDPALLEVVGRAQMLLGRHDDALFTFKGLVNLRPDSAWAHLELAEAYLAKRTPGNPQWSAISEADQAVELDPQNEAAKVVLARAQISHERFVEAEETVSALKKDHPKDQVVSEIVGLIAVGQHRDADAAAAFGQAIATSDNGLDRRRLAEAQERLGKADEAAATLAGWLQGHPADVENRKALASILVSSGKFEEGREQLVEIVKQDPKDAIMQNDLAWTLSRLGKSDEALLHAQEAVTLDPHSADNLDTLGVILLDSGSSQDAVKDLREAQRFADDRPDIGVHLSRALIAAGNRTAAKDVLSKLLASDQPFKDRAEAQKLLQQLSD